MLLACCSRAEWIYSHGDEGRWNRACRASFGSSLEACMASATGRDDDSGCTCPCMYKNGECACGHSRPPHLDGEVDLLSMHMASYCLWVVTV